MSKIDVKFVAKIQKSPHRGGWTYVVWPEAADFFGTHGAVKVQGTVNGEPLTSSFMAMGDGVQMLPVKGAILKAIKKAPGDEVEVVLNERL